MFTARQKKKENIAEYVLYMWQIEDLIRSCNFEIDVIENSIINSFEGNEAERVAIRNWYEKLIVSMGDERVKEKGHLEEITYLIAELHMLHQTLINILQDPKYLQLYQEASQSIEELKQRSNKKNTSDIEACFNGLYGTLLLKLQKRKISNETMKAINSISTMMVYLSKKHKQVKAGELDFPKVMNN
ncbi:MAG: DUF4924 domain-containing protein [Flavobacteriales bacterium]|nr:MAG: DUF4924 domain-containing protein [Flavobacteriales bacterium]